MSERICLGCTAVITPGPRERNPKRWCSPACRARTEYAAGKRSHHYPRCHIWTPACIECGNPFTARSQRADTCPLPKCQDAKRAKRAPHGTITGYTSWACRCDECRLAWNAHIRAKRQSEPKNRTPCSGCGEPLKQTSLDEPVCRACVDRAQRILHRALLLEQLQKQPPPRSWTSGPCSWCATQFVMQRPDGAYCTARCARKAKAVRRRGRIAGMPGTYTWAEVMRLFLTFDRRCAYCTQPVIGQPDPDHVVPLSRGGLNSITNILPCCRLCNSDKRDLLLDEWAADRIRRGLPSRTTSWCAEDTRFAHLVIDNTAA